MAQAAAGWRELDGLTERARAMLGYADALRAADVLAVSLVVAYDNFVNRLAEGLGVELDPPEVAGYRY